MSRTDFCRCTPSEFYETYSRWAEREQQRERGEWERMRMQCLCTLQPYAQQRLTAHDIMRFPWDDTPEEAASHETLTDEEKQRRFEEIKKERGLE